MVNKQIFSMKNLLMAGTVAVLGLMACEKDENPTPIKTVFALTASANSAQEVPTNASTGTGSMTGTYDSVSNVLTYSFIWSGLTGNVTNMHFHGPALPGVSAGVAQGTPGFPAVPAGSFNGTLTLTAAHEADLFAGKWYWNVHTAANGGGEIRGQVAIN